MFAAKLWDGLEKFRPLTWPKLSGRKPIMSSTSCGIATLIIAGVTNASFTMPMKYARKWAWENTWLAWTVFALVVLPFAAAFVTIPHLSLVYRSTPLDIVLE